MCSKVLIIPQHSSGNYGTWAKLIKETKSVNFLDKDSTLSIIIEIYLWHHQIYYRTYMRCSSVSICMKCSRILSHGYFYSFIGISGASHVFVFMCYIKEANFNGTNQVFSTRQSMIELCSRQTYEQLQWQVCQTYRFCEQLHLPHYQPPQPFQPRNTYYSNLHGGIFYLSESTSPA